MLISNFNKKILLLLFLTFSYGNACATEHLNKINENIKFPVLKVLDSKEKTLILDFNH